MSDKLDQAPGHVRRDEPDGFTKRNVIEEDDVEGHVMVRGGDDAQLRRDAEDGAIKRVDPGEGHISRS